MTDHHCQNRHMVAFPLSHHESLSGEFSEMVVHSLTLDYDWQETYKPCDFLAWRVCNIPTTACYAVHVWLLVCVTMVNDRYSLHFFLVQLELVAMALIHNLQMQWNMIWLACKYMHADVPLSISSAFISNMSNKLLCSAWLPLCSFPSPLR